MHPIEDVVQNLRQLFPSLNRRCPDSDQPVIYLDGPAGSQVPQSVIDAIGQYYLHHNANSAGMFPTSRETTQIMHDAHQAAADWFGTTEPNECIFGANMTTLTLAFSRALSRTWQRGDRIVVTQLDHDGNVTPWRLAAKDVGVEVDTVRVDPSDATLDEEDYRRKISSRTKLVAFTAASNSVGTTNEIKKLTKIAHEAGAEVFVDAVHWAPHRLIDVKDWEVDFCVCSAYKFFGPHVGMLWGNLARLEELTPYKLRPAPQHCPGKWMTGTQNFAAIAGVQAAIDYVASIARHVSPSAISLTRRDSLRLAFDAIRSYENNLATQLIEGLQSLPRVRVFGIVDRNRVDSRVPTVAFTVDGIPSIRVAQRLGERGIFCWHGHYYAVDICEALGQSEHGMVRVGILHTNTSKEIDRFLSELQAFLSEG
jgi:cysteine desulfurase family protein (TIGR01976 family)